MRKISRVAVLGAGVMGANIGAHLANAGLEVLLLDIVPKELTQEEKAKGLTLESPEVRSRFSAKGLQGAVKGKPAAFYAKDYARLVEVGNFDDDMEKIGSCDWVIEAVLENMEIKRQLFTDKVVPNLAEGAILSTNTSGLSVNEMAKILPEEVRKRFLVTHFFNPPRYMRLMELVPCSETDPQVVKYMAEFIGKRLGKGNVYAKDTPNFIANRIGTYAGCNVGKHMVEMGLTVEEADAITGPAIARPKTASFALADLVGIDTYARITVNTYDLLEHDEEREIFRVPEFVNKMIDAGLIGKKVNAGYYKKEKVDGKKQLSFFDYQSGEYKPVQKPKYASVGAAKQIDDPAKRLKAVVSGNDVAAEFAWKTLRDTLLYTFKRIPEIADDVVNVDNAMKWGYNWELGPFEVFDALGVAYFVERTEKDGLRVPEQLKSIERFYKVEAGREYYFDLASGSYREIPVEPGKLRLDLIKQTDGVVEKNASCSILDLGDGVFGLEFHSKMNAISSDILAMTHKAVKRAEEDGVGLVVGNQGGVFSAGANLMMLAMAIAEGAFDEINMSIKAFQNATMALKYAQVPVVAAPYNLALGGGCEFVLHSDAINAHAETYLGLVEVGVGLLPGGGGTKEMTVRAIQLAAQYGADVQTFLIPHFQNIATAKVSTSAAELKGMNYLRSGDSITMDIGNLIADAKQKVLTLARNYRPQRPLENLPAPGRSVAATIKSQLWNMKMGRFVSDYDAELAGVIADVMGGGNVPAGTLVSEQYLLEVEREGFLKLCGNKKTMERIQNILKTGKPLRN